MTTSNGRPQHPFYTNERVARVVAQRLVSEGRDVGPWRDPPATIEEHAKRVEVLTEKIKERGLPQLTDKQKEKRNK